MHDTLGLGGLPDERDVGARRNVMAWGNPDRLVEAEVAGHHFFGRWRAPAPERLLTQFGRWNDP